MTRRRLAVGAILLAALALALWGWNLFYFITDDAYIAFRYVHNLLAGRGLVWNPPPFRPVEGYTSLLWVLILGAAWRVFGVAPTESANLLSLALSGATLGLVGRLVWRMSLPERLEGYRPAFLAFVLFGPLTNRTYLAWMSSGLETALFNFCFTLWIFGLSRFRSDRTGAWRFVTCLAATLVALTRPDGVLAVAATLALLVLARFDAAQLRRSPTAALLAAAPLLGSPAHFLWRRAYYGEWLPNTYYAKIDEPWPEAGLRYLASFVLEYAWWTWLVLLAYCVYRILRRPESPALGVLKRNYPLALGLGALAAQLGYYTILVGGDHFEYRILSHLVPLIFVSSVWAVARLGLAPARAFVALAVILVASCPIPWAHYLETRKLTSREETWVMIRPVAQHFPGWVRPYVSLFDELQSWLITHHVGMRHQEHKIFEQYQWSRFPSRAEGESIGRDELVVMAEGVIGIPGWVFPNVAILDFVGLTDHVVARTAPRHTQPGGPARRRGVPGDLRLMAHDRRPPEGYLACFLGADPKPSQLVVVAPERVRACEALYWDGAPPQVQSRMAGTSSPCSWM